MGDLRRRTVTAVVYAAIVLVALGFDGPWFTLVLLALFVVGLWELWRLARAIRGFAREVTMFVAGALVLGGGLFSLLYLTSYVQGASDLGATGLLPPWRRGWIYPWVYLALVPVWAGDVGAYVAGSVIGRRKVAPRISPGKTWEGTLAGFLAAAIAVWFVGTQVFSPGLPTEILAPVALAVGPAGLCGDLLESALKRAAGVKDSGTIFPGHGGVLDRIDSLLLVAPVIALALSAYRSGMMEL